MTPLRQLAAGGADDAERPAPEHPERAARRTDQSIDQNTGTPFLTRRQFTTWKLAGSMVPCAEA